MMIVAGLLLRDDPAGVSMPPPTTVSQPTSVALQPTVAQATATVSLPFPDIPRISLQDAQSRLEDPGVVFVDVRAGEVVTLLGIILLLEVRPMVTLIGWRIQLSRGNAIDTRLANRFARTSVVQTLLVIAMVFVATAMARGIGA